MPGVDRYTLADAVMMCYLSESIGRAAPVSGKPTTVLDWFTRIKARPSFKGISDYRSTDYDEPVVMVARMDTDQ